MFNNMRFVVIDFETFWDSKSYTLSKMGPIEYIDDPRFDPFMFGFGIVGEVRVDVVVGGPEVRRAIADLQLGRDDTYIVGHNVNGFDGLILSRYFRIPGIKCIDTMVLARWLGVSRVVGESHASLTKALGTGYKKQGTLITDGKHWNDLPENERAEFTAYCRNDVAQCRDNFVRMLAMLGRTTPKNFINMPLVGSVMTARMAGYPKFVLDKCKIEAFISNLDDETTKARESVRHLLGAADNETFLKRIRSKVTLAEALRGLGVEPPMKVSAKKTASSGDIVYDYAFSKTDKEFTELLEHENPEVVALVEARLGQNSSIHRTRAERLLSLAKDDKRMPVMLNAFKAHTGRYTAGNVGGKTDGLGVQNLSKHNPKYRELRTAIKVPDGHTIVACDSSQIEARLLAWLAGEEELIEQFRDGRDAYSELATHFPGAPSDAKEISQGAKAGDKKLKMLRQIGKKAILSAGYGVSYRVMAKSFWNEGTRFSTNYDEHVEETKKYHTIYRSRNRNIVAFWHTCENAIHAMYSCGSYVFGGPTGDFVNAVGSDSLYSGMCENIVSTVTTKFGFKLVYTDLKYSPDTGYYYQQWLGKQAFSTKLYGGKLTENIVQSTAFLLMMWQACNIAKDPNTIPVCNIHDSWAVVVPSIDEQAVKYAADRMQFWMSQVPECMNGFPVACEVETGYDFTVV